MVFLYLSVECQTLDSYKCPQSAQINFEEKEFLEEKEYLSLCLLSSSSCTKSHSSFGMIPG